MDNKVDINMQNIPAGFIIGLLTVVGIVIIGYILTSPRSRDTTLSIFAALVQQDKNNSSLQGHVVRKGTPVAEVTVWAVLEDARGYRNSPRPTKTNEEGAFIIESAPTSIEGRAVEQIRLYAYRQFEKPVLFGWTSTSITEEGEEVLALGRGPFRRIELSGWPLIAPPMIFFASMFTALIGPASPFKYGFLLCVTFFLTITMIIAISLGLSYVHTTSDKNDVLSLGYASLFRGQYVRDVEPEWLLSVTAPPEPPRSSADDRTVLVSGPPESSRSSRDNNPIDDRGQQLLSSRGIGAPLWVLLLAVVGAALKTILILVDQIKSRPTFIDSEALRAVDEKIDLFVRHQFFILFAPLAAILVYQLLVIAEAATQPVTVALVALGAGLTLTTLIERAVAMAGTYAKNGDPNK